MMLLSPIWKTAEAVRALALYMRSDYLTAYAKHTNQRVSKDAQAAIGGFWEDIGHLQFDFLVRRGLQPTDTMLDIGCGTLRGGQHFIWHLDPGHYIGTDLSSEALEAGAVLINAIGLQGKCARLLLTQDLQFNEFQVETFDFVLAQSVFTHLPKTYIEECFRHIHRIMHKGTRFYFTWNDALKARRTDLKTFEYPFAYFYELAMEHGYNLKDMSNDYPHPRGQRMAELALTACGGRQ